MKDLVKAIWNFFLFGLSLAFFGILGTVTFELGQSAFKLHKQGLMSLSQLTHSLENPNQTRKP